MNIRIYGPGCARCAELAANVETALRGSETEAVVEKIQDIGTIVSEGILETPALAIDGRIVCSGKIPSAEEIAGIIAPGKPFRMPRLAARFSMKRFFGLLLAAFALGSLAFAFLRDSGTGETGSGMQTSAETTTLYYFHGNARCRTCLRMEELAKQSAELAKGRLVFRTVNLDEAPNEHFVRDFALSMRCVVVAKGNRFEKLEDLWGLVGNPELFSERIRKAVGNMMGIPE